jgi:phenylacetate-CoA ligase
VSLRAWPLARLRRSPWAREELARTAALERDPSAAGALASERLRAVLGHAGRHAPYWAETFAAHGLDPSRVRGVEDLAALPLLERETLRARWRDFQSTAVPDARAIMTRTSGTTGGGLAVRATPEAYARTWAQQLRHWGWAGLTPDTWRVSCFGSEVVPRLTAPRRLWVYNVPDRQVLLSAYHLAPRFADRYRAWLERRVLPVEGFPSVLADLASLLGPAPAGRPRARVVFTTGEALLPEMRRRIAEAFGAPVLDQYGQDEKVGWVLECPAGTYHQILEYGVLEVVDDAGRALPPGEEGHLVWTGLVNSAMPLIRYRIGDRGARVPGGDRCRCGVRYPAVAPTLTRTGDSLRLAGGQRVSPRLLNQCLKECRSLAAAQFVQEAPDRVAIVVEPLSLDAPAEAAALAERLGQVFGGRVRFESRVVSEIARDPSAKRRLVVVRGGADGR